MRLNSSSWGGNGFDGVEKDFMYGNVRIFWGYIDIIMYFMYSYILSNFGGSQS